MPTDYISAINELAEEISNTAEAHGFWTPDDVGDRGIIPLKLALIHAETSEALEVIRERYDDSEPDPDTGLSEMGEEDLTEELADVIIRCLDLAGYYGFDIGRVLISKVEKNKTRPFLHGKRF